MVISLTPEDAVSTSNDTRYNRDRFRQPVIFLRNNVTEKKLVMTSDASKID